MEVEDLEKIEKEHYKQIDFLIKKYPESFIELIMFWDKLLTVQLPIGLFKCRCGKIINHQQFAFSRCCGNCDLSPKVRKEQRLDYRITLFKIGERLNPTQKVHQR